MSDKTSIPLIDVTSLTSGTGDARAVAKTAAEVRDACENIGFFLVKGHGVPEHLIAGTYSAARAFFDLPREEKLKVKRRSPEVSRGYNSLADQSLAASRGVSAPPDLQESINFGPLDAGADPYFTEGYGAVHFAPNLWPDVPAAFRPTVTSYYRAMETLAASLMRGFSLALDLPPDFFTAKIDRHVSSLRFINYPDQPDRPKDDQLRAGEHSDYGSLTILKVEDAPGGLQVQDRAGRWIDVGYVPGTFVVNIGDLMMQWTNDRWISTVHRVLNPPRDVASGSRRISMVFFHQPNYDAEIVCIPSCAATGQPPKYGATTSGAHWRAKNQAARSVAKATA